MINKSYRKVLFFILVLIVLTATALVVTSTSAASADDFVITVKTDNQGPSSDTQFTIPTFGAGYNYNVDCNNDGSDEITGATGNVTCEYGSAGTYTVRIKDNSG